jgi:hypothetical protein
VRFTNETFQSKSLLEEKTVTVELGKSKQWAPNSRLNPTTTKIQKNSLKSVEIFSSKNFN